MVRNIKQLLKDLGWADGFNIPVANEENKKLEAEVEKLILNKADIIIQYENTQERLTNMKNMLRKIVKEKEDNQLLLNKLRQSLETETTMMNTSESNRKAKDLDIKDLKKEISQTDTKSIAAREQIQVYTTKITELKEHLNWGEDALFAWEEDLAREDKDFDFIKYYKNVDQHKYNELEHKRQLAQLELNQLIEIENREADKLECLENHFFHLCRDFKQVEVERTYLLQMWQNINDTIKNREKKIDKIKEKIDATKDEMRQNLVKYIALEKSFEALQDENNYYVEQYTLLENRQPHLIDQVESLSNVLKNFEDETEALKQKIKQLEYEFNLQILKNKELKQSMEANTAKFQPINDGNEKLLTKLGTIEIEKMTAEQRCKTAEEIYEMGKKMLKEESNEIIRIETIIKKLNTEHEELKEKNKVEKNKLNDLISRLKEINQQIKSGEAELQELQNTEFNLEMELVDSAHKMNILQGVSVDTEAQTRLKIQLAEYEEEISQKTKDLNKVKMEIRTFTKELTFIQLDINRAENETNQLKVKIEESRCCISGGKRAFMKAQEEYNKCTLKLNLLKMQISFAEENKKKEGLSLSILERQKLYLDTAMHERITEIEGYKEVIVAQRKSLNEEKSFLKRSIDHLVAKIKVLEKKYEVTLDMLGKSEDGERMSLTNIKLKMAQEKTALQDLGDELEARINKTEREIEAFENTLRAVTNTNENFKSNLEALDMDSEEVQEFKRVENEYYKTIKNNEQLKEELDEVNSRIKELQRKIKKIKQLGEEAQQEWKIKEREVMTLTKDLAGKQIKLERATKILQKLFREVNLKAPTIGRALALRDIEVRIEADRNKCVLQQLAEMASTYIQTSPIINKYLNEKGLTLPHSQEFTFAMKTSTPDVRSSEGGSRLSVLSDVSLTPSVVHLDPTVLLPTKYQRPICRK